MRKLLLMACSGLLTLSLTGAMPTLSPGSADDPPPRKKGEAEKKGEPGPQGDLHRAYDLLRKIKAEDGVGGRADERLRGWTDRAASLYRRGVQAYADGDHHRAHELGLAAHDLARTVDHAKNAALLDHADPDLPPPPPNGVGPAGDAAQARRDLRHAFDRIGELEDDADQESKYYLDGARELYTAARRDAEDGRTELAAELAKAAEALTHVPEHLARATEDAPEPPKAAPKPKAKKKADGPEPKAKKDAHPQADDELPPPLTPRR